MSKYHAIKTVLGGIRFDSRAEAQRWGQLQLLERAHVIRDLKRQVRHELVVNGERVCAYVSDFEYQELYGTAWRAIVEDVKGVKTPEYRLKKKLMKAIHGIEIRETGALAKRKRKAPPNVMSGARRQAKG